MVWKLYSDGGSRPNPGKAAYSAALYLESSLVERVGGYMGTSTNNKAEYKAFRSGLQLIKEHCDLDDDIEVYLDSQLVLNQIQGKWSVKEESLRSVSDECKEIICSYENLEMNWVKGHSGDPGNEYVDSVCTYFISKDSQGNDVKYTNEAATTSINSDRMYLTCPYADKDAAKKLGARWDTGAKKWYIRGDMDVELFKKWL